MLSWGRRKRSIVTEDFFNKAGERALQVGDICLTAAAHKPRYIGLKVDLVADLPEFGAVPSAELLVIRSKDHSKLPPESLLFFLRSSEGYEQIQSMVRGSTAHLYPGDLTELQVVIDNDQDRIETIRNAFNEAASAHKRSLDLQAQAYLAAGLEPFHSPSEED
jgi:hypothetical protein